MNDASESNESNKTTARADVRLSGTAQCRAERCCSALKALPCTRHWLEEAIGASATGAALTVMPMVLASFLRLVTSPKVFRVPTLIEDTVAFVDALLTLPGVHLATSGPEWSKLRQLCIDKRLTGNDLPDAWLAAAVSCLGEHLVSFDRDFRKLLTRSQLTLLARG